jgi:hypothetical protein
MWIWTAFPFSVLEPWEVILLRTCSGLAFVSIVFGRFFAVLVMILSILSVLVLTALFKYLPQQLVFMQRRAGYYLWGQETLADERFSFQQSKEL